MSKTYLSRRAEIIKARISLHSLWIQTPFRVTQLTTIKPIVRSFSNIKRETSGWTMLQAMEDTLENILDFSC